MIKLVIFDMDGVIMDSEPMHTASENRIFSELLGGSDYRAKDRVGNSARENYLKAMAHLGIPETESVNGEIIERLHFTYTREGVVASGMEVTAGLLDALDSMAAAGVRFAVASSSVDYYVYPLLEHFGIRGRFSVVVTGSDVARIKPDPEIYLKTLELAGVSPEEAAVVEDSRAGVRAAKSAGIKTVVGYANPTSGAQDLSMADRVIEYGGMGSLPQVLGIR